MSALKHGSIVEIDCECCHLLYEQGSVFDGLAQETRDAFVAIADETLHAMTTALGMLATVDTIEKGELLLNSFNQCMVLLHEACRQVDTDEDGMSVSDEEPVRYGMYL